MKNTSKLICFGFLSLAACQQNNEPETGGATLKLKIDGKTKVYNDARFSEGSLGSVTAITFDAGSAGADNLTFNVYGTTVGIYPYKAKMSDYKQVSQVEYKTDGKVLSNYFVRICPDQSGYYSTVGEIKIEEYVAGKHVKGTFSGDLLDANSQDECNPETKSFSGEFDITMP